MTAHLDSWVAVLDRLEDELVRAERRLDGLETGPAAVPAWVPPTVAGPPPADLLPRATALHQRQLAVLNRYAAAMQRATGEQAYVDTALAAGHARARYVDVAG